GSLPENAASVYHFPRVFAWMKRFRAALEKAKTWARKGMILKARDTDKAILSSEPTEPKGRVEQANPWDLSKGAEVEMYGAIWGHRYRDGGLLVVQMG
ncbi:hypothetical protein EJ04DRAFT_451316, partial [Polyplosphaeria fusca]